MTRMATREAYGKALAKLIQEREDVVVLDADLAGSTKTIDAKRVCPARHFDMGIAEGNMMGVAAGLAASGKLPYVSSFAMFAAGRAFEQIRNSIGYPHLNVKICATHAGLSVGEDGATHQCNEDLALMRTIPGMVVLQPSDEIETDAIIQEISRWKGPCYVRLSRKVVENIHDKTYQFQIGKGEILRRGTRIALLASGILVQEALQAAEQVDEEITVINFATIKPIDKELVIEIAKTHELLITCEEHSIIGGLGSAVAEVLAEENLSTTLQRIGVQDTFGESGKPEELLEKYKINANAILDVIHNRG